MEPLSIAASFIAMGQAIAAIPKIIAILRSATELGYELAGLLNELATLQAIQLSVEDSITALSGADHLYQIGRPETQLLLRTRNDLTDLVDGLQTLAERCSRKLGEHGLPRPNHLKLLWKSKDINRLRERARTICIHINLALSQISLVSQVTQTKLLLEIHSVTVPSTLPLREVQQAIQTLSSIQSLPDSTSSSAVLDCDVPSSMVTDKKAERIPLPAGAPRGF
ncbi:uncharacterized protein BDW43DRAFT_290066, partial [Aspergillus alliaceus]|uniref:uncharacterized protein n=1 Tax=Petromyces alliaceus TaxID=209559 RepID=UPI0012A66807